MPLEFTQDYSNHVLLESKNKYKKIFKLTEAEASDIIKGDIVLIQKADNSYALYIATADSTDYTLHLTKYTDTNFVKDNCDMLESNGTLNSADNSCVCGKEYCHCSYDGQC